MAGELGGRAGEELAASIVRVVIAGNSVGEAAQADLLAGQVGRLGEGAGGRGWGGPGMRVRNRFTYGLVSSFFISEGGGGGMGMGGRFTQPQLGWGWGGWGGRRFLTRRGEC